MVFKNTKKPDGLENQPEYRMVITGEDGKLKNIGGCWKKLQKDGSTFLSCRTSDYVKPAPMKEIKYPDGDPEDPLF